MTQPSACAAARFGTAPAVPPRETVAQSARLFLTRTGISVLAASAGLAAANMYYAQPLLIDIAQSLHLSDAAVGLVPALTQLGVSLGVLCLLPLGDVMPVRRSLLDGCDRSAGVGPCRDTAFAPTGTSLLLISLLVGFFGITPYILPPYATLRAAPERRGHVTALLAQGVIVGMLLSRSVSGVLGLHFGWRSVYIVAAIGMLGMLIPLRRTVHDIPAATRTSYRALMRSLLDVFLTVPAARWSALCQAAATGSFTALWVGISFYMQSPAFNWRSDGVGGLALIGAAAAVFAPIVGRVADRKGPRRSLLLALATLTLSWLVLFGFGGHVAGIIVGMIVLDLGATSADISNRTVIFSLRPEIRTRLAAIYMVGKFGGAGLMAWLAGVVWSYAGWPGVCALWGRLSRRGAADRALPHRSSRHPLMPSPQHRSARIWSSCARSRWCKSNTPFVAASCSAAAVNRLFETTTAKSASSWARAAAASCTDLLPTGRAYSLHCRTIRMRFFSAITSTPWSRLCTHRSSHGRSSRPAAIVLRRMLRTATGVISSENSSPTGQSVSERRLHPIPDRSGHAVMVARQGLLFGRR